MVIYVVHPIIYAPTPIKPSYQSGVIGQGWRAVRTQWKKASDILSSTLAAFLFSSHPKWKGIERLS